MKIVPNECRPSLVFDLGGVVFDWNPKALLNDLRLNLGLADGALDLLHRAVFQDYGLGSDWISFDRGLIRTNVLASRIAMRLEAGIGKADYGLGEDEDQIADSFKGSTRSPLNRHDKATGRAVRPCPHPDRSNPPMAQFNRSAPPTNAGNSRHAAASTQQRVSAPLSVEHAHTIY